MVSLLKQIINVDSPINIKYNDLLLFVRWTPTTMYSGAMGLVLGRRDTTILVKSMSKERLVYIRTVHIDPDYYEKLHQSKTVSQRMVFDFLSLTCLYLFILEL